MKTSNKHTLSKVLTLVFRTFATTMSLKDFIDDNDLKLTPKQLAEAETVNIESRKNKIKELMNLEPKINVYLTEQHSGQEIKLTADQLFKSEPIRPHLRLISSKTIETDTQAQHKQHSTG